MEAPLEALVRDELEEKSACPTLLVGVMIVWKERRKDIIVDGTNRCWERRYPYYRRYTKM
jgi:hypothetical protein